MLIKNMVCEVSREQKIKKSKTLSSPPSSSSPGRIRSGTARSQACAWDTRIEKTFTRTRSEKGVLLQLSPCSPPANRTETEPTPCTIRGPTEPKPYRNHTESVPESKPKPHRNPTETTPEPHRNHTETTPETTPETMPEPSRNHPEPSRNHLENQSQNHPETIPKPSRNFSEISQTLVFVTF